jgi:hypothetical protein
MNILLFLLFQLHVGGVPTSTLADTAIKVRPQKFDSCSKADTVLKKVQSCVTADSALEPDSARVKAWVGSTSSKDTRGYTYIIAASDSKDTSKADFICKGTSSDDTLINRVASSLKNKGGTIKFLEGNYYITAQIFLHDSVNYDGSGDGTVFKPTGSSIYVFQLNDSVRTCGCKLSNFMITANGKTGIIGIGYGFNISNENYGGLVIERIVFNGIYQGMYYIVGGWKSVVVRDCNFASCTQGISNVYPLIVEGSNFQYCSYGITGVGAGTVVGHNKFKDDAHGMVGINIGAVADVNISDNIFQTITTPIWIVGGYRINIVDNEIYDPRGGYGIYVNTNAYDNNINGNTIKVELSSVGIYIGGSGTISNGNSIVNNSISGIGLPCIQDYGVGTKIVGNFCRNTASVLQAIRLQGRRTLVSNNSFNTANMTNLVRMVGTDSCNINVNTINPSVSIAVWDSNGTYNRINGSGTLWSGKRNFTSTWTADTFVSTEFSVNSKFNVNWLGTAAPTNMVYPITGKEDTVIFVLLGGVADTAKARADGIYWKREDTN